MELRDCAERAELGQAQLNLLSTIAEKKKSNKTHTAVLSVVYAGAAMIPLFLLYRSDRESLIPTLIWTHL